VLLLRKDEMGRRVTTPISTKEAKATKRKLKKDEMWELFFMLNRAKVFLNIIRCMASRIQREVEWAQFVKRGWFEDSDSFDLFLNDAVYGISFQHSAAEYEGETKVGTERRSRTHVQKTWSKSKKHKLQKWLIAIGCHRAVFTPVRTWMDPTTKIQRLRQEGRYIWERQGSLNETGTESWQDKSNATWAVVFGRRKRVRLFARFEAIRKTELVESNPTTVSDQTKAKTATGKREKHDADRVLKGRLLGTLARLARRPWKKGTDIDSLQTVITLRKMAQSTVKRITRMAFENLDTTSRSIAVSNLKVSLAIRKDVIFTTWRISSEVLQSTECHRAMLNAMKSWANDWHRRAGVLIVVEVQAYEKAANSILTILDSTKMKGKQSWDDMR